MKASKPVAATPEQAPRTWRGGIPLQSLYTAGLGGQVFFKALKERGEIVGTRCRDCKQVYVPARAFCERCFRPTDDWVYVQDTGKVNTFSLCYVSWDVQRLKTPEIPAVIEIDGAAPGEGIMHKLGNVKPKDVRVGMKVRAVWKPAGERTGGITDIKYFEPIKGGSKKR